MYCTVPESEEEVGREQEESTTDGALRQPASPLNHRAEPHGTKGLGDHWFVKRTQHFAGVQQSEEEVGPEQEERTTDGALRQPASALSDGTQLTETCDSEDEDEVRPVQSEFTPRGAEQQPTSPTQNEKQQQVPTPVKVQTIRHLKDIGLDPVTNSAVNKTLYLFDIKEQFKHMPTDVKRDAFMEPVGGCKLRYAQKSVIGRALRLSRHYIFPTKKQSSRKNVSTRRRMADYKRRAVDQFLRQDDNCYTLPDKKHYRKDHGVPIVALVDSMRNLHRKFVVETGLALSFATFCKARDKRTVKTSVFLKRSVCLCKPHANMGLLLEAVQGLPRRTSQLLLLSDEDVVKVLNADTSTFFSFKEWEKIPRFYGTGKKKKKVYHTQLSKLTLDKKKFISKFKKDLKSFRKHQARVEAQYEAVKTLKENLPAHHAICQMDYAENWPTGFFAEIQSAFFGKDQLTLHPMVAYVRQSELQQEDEEVVGPEQEERTTDGDPQQPTTDPLKHFNFVGVSEVKKHSFPTTLTFLVHLMHEIRLLLPDLEHLHLITDSPSSQYRNRYACDMLQRAADMFGIRITWNWLEAGHGKGPCDGVGGAIKGLADRTVKICGAIQNVDEFIHYVQPRTEKVKMLKGEKQTIDINTEMVEGWNSPGVKGITKMHQATVVDSQLYLRKTSCYKECCLSDDLRPQCSGWVKNGAATVDSDPSDSSGSDSECEEEREEREAEEDVAGENESADLETQFSSEEEDDDEVVHNSHRTIRRSARLINAVPAKQDAIETESDLEEESEDEVEDEPDSIQDRDLDERIAGQRRSGQFVNEVEEGETSSDEWAVQDTMSIRWNIEHGFLPRPAPNKVDNWTLRKNTEST